jgi:hypothetical protein
MAPDSLTSLGYVLVGVQVNLTSSYLTERQSHSTKMLSMQRPLPSMLILMPRSSNEVDPRSSLLGGKLPWLWAACPWLPARAEGAAECCAMRLGWSSCMPAYGFGPGTLSDVHAKAGFNPHDGVDGRGVGKPSNTSVVTRRTGGHWRHDEQGVGALLRTRGWRSTWRSPA